MRLGAPTGAFVLWASLAAGQPNGGTKPAESPRRFGLVAGIGNSVGGIGVGGEAYLAHSRLSLFGGVGYLHAWGSDYSSEGLGVAGGARLFTAGRRHRGFLEASLSPVSVAGTVINGVVVEKQTSYGPGLSIGYQFVSSSGITLVLANGVAYGMTGPDFARGTQLLATYAVGYTWRR